jgi:hypothetical protein
MPINTLHWMASMSAAVTPIAFVKAYTRRGMDPLRALAQAQIAPEALLDPAARISALQMERISGAAMQEPDDEGLGWFSHRLPWGSYGMLARASLRAPTLALALKRWYRHPGLLTSDITLQLSVASDTGTLSITENCDLGQLREFCVVSVLCNIHGLASWLIDSRIALLRARLSVAAPTHVAV